MDFGPIGELGYLGGGEVAARTRRWAKRRTCRSGRQCLLSSGKSSVRSRLGVGSILKSEARQIQVATAVHSDLRVVDKF